MLEATRGVLSDLAALLFTLATNTTVYAVTNWYGQRVLLKTDD